MKRTESVLVLHPSFARTVMLFIGGLGHAVTEQFPATLFSFVLSDNSICIFVGTL